MSVARGAVLLVVCAASASGGATSATACACGESQGLLVGSGKSPAGMPWRINAQMDGKHWVQVDFSYLPPGYSDAGGTESLPYPLPKGLAFTATLGSALNPSDEADVSGVAARRVARVVVWMKDGSKAVARPRLAAHRVYRRYKWVRRLRFYDKFIPSSAEPVKAVARDWSGRVVGRMRLYP